MSSEPPPNEELAELVAVLGDDNVRMLVRTFLQEFPGSLSQLGASDRKTRHRIAHSMKSNSRLVGAHGLSKRMAELEARLSDESGNDVAPEDLAAISNDFEVIAGPLKRYAGEENSAGTMQL